MESDVKPMDKEPKRVYHILLLFLLAFLGPFLIGYQYLEWFHDSSSHMTWFIATGIGSIENSDWTGNVWFLRTIFSDGSLPSTAILAFFSIFLVPRILFAVAVSMYEFDRLGKAYVAAAAIPAIAVTIWMTFQMMTLSIILGTPPGVLISIIAPDIDSRLFLPTPFLLVLGFIIIRSKK